MVVMKCNTANNELFIKPIHGFYAKYVTSVEDFKDRNAGIMKNRWVDTCHGDQGEKIYELFHSPNGWRHHERIFAGVALR